MKCDSCGSNIIKYPCKVCGYCDREFAIGCDGCGHYKDDKCSKKSEEEIRANAERLQAIEDGKGE